MTHIYLDIDGVILHENGSIPEGLDEFLSFLLANYHCYWPR